MNKTRIAAGALSLTLLLGGGMSLRAAAVQSGYTVSAATTGTVTVTADNLNVRAGAGSSYNVTAGLSKGASVKISETKKDSRGNTWGKLSSGKGWINLKYTSANTTVTMDSIQQSSGTYNVKTTGALNIRSGAGTNYEVVDTLRKGSVVEISSAKKDSRGNTWGKLSNGKGWINVKYVVKTTESASNQGTTQQSGTSVAYNVKLNCDLNVRSGAGTNYGVVNTLDKNKVLAIVAEQKDSRGNTWGKLGDGTGWINLSYTTKTGDNANQGGTQNQQSVSSVNVKVSCELNVRKGVGTGTAVVGSLKENAVVTIVEAKKDSRGNTWGKLSDGSGWINLKYTTATTANNNQNTNNQQSGQSTAVNYTVKNNGKLYIRKDAGTNYSDVGILSNGTTVTIVAEKKDSKGNLWGKLSDGRGWISLKFTSKTGTQNTQNTQNAQNTQNTSFKPYKVKIATEALYVRQTADRNGTISGTVFKGEELTIVEEAVYGAWGKLSDGRGWISLKYTTKS